MKILHSIFGGKKKLEEQEELYLSVIKKMISRPDTLIEINPDSMDYLLSLEKESYFISVDSIGIQISNHAFLILRRFEENVLNEAKGIIKEEAAKRRETKKKEIFDNEVTLLNKIKDSL